LKEKGPDGSSGGKSPIIAEEGWNPSAGGSKKNKGLMVGAEVCNLKRDRKLICKRGSSRGSRAHPPGS